jgi:hypothetical protein
VVSNSGYHEPLEEFPMRILTPAVLAGLLPALCGAGGLPPTYPCYRAATAPTLDGVIAGDPAWVAAPVATGFSKLGASYTAAKQTFVQACWDAEALYVGIVCEEPDIALIKPTVRDGGDTWLDDGVEVFLQPAPDATVVQFVVTAAGAKGGYEGAPDFLKYEAAAHHGPDFYSLELRLPFDLIGPAPGVGDSWRGNFCRNTFATRSGGDKFTCWAPLESRFLEPGNFATLGFLGPAPTPAQVAEQTEALNRPYRTELIRRLGTTAAVAPEYAPTLREAAGDARFGEQARGLLARWERLAGALTEAGRTPVIDLRHVLQDAQDLAQDSYDTKYAYLIAHVLGD